MTSPLADQVQAAVGEPSSIRIGTVTSVSPLKVDVQGTEYTDLGLIGDCPDIGYTVALIGQSTSAGSEPTSWMVVGEVGGGCDPGGVRFAGQTDQITITDNDEHDVPAFTFAGAMRPGRLYELRCTFLVASSAGAGDFPFARMYQGSTAVYGQYARTLAGNVYTYNAIEAWLRPAEAVSAVFKLSAQRLFGASTFIVASMQNGVFALIDHGVTPNVATVA